MDIYELIMNGYAEKAYVENSVGGNYTEAHFFDNDYNYTTKDLAMHVVIKEFDVNGIVKNEIVMSRDVNMSKKSK